MFARQLADLLVIEALGIGVDGVAYDVVVDAAAIHRAAMREMTTHYQVHAHNGIANIKQRAVNGVVGRGARERLNIDV